MADREIFFPDNIPRIGRIFVARGRDAEDIPLIYSFGPHALKSFRVLDLRGTLIFPADRAVGSSRKAPSRFRS